MEQELNMDRLDDLLEDFKNEFEYDFDFKVKLVLDDTVKDYYGEKFQNIKINLENTDTRSNIDILINTNYETYYDYYDGNLDKIYPDGLWKYMYFKLLETTKTIK